MQLFMDKHIKIVATIGPASCKPETLGFLRSAGMNAARINLSHVRQVNSCGVHSGAPEKSKRFRFAGGRSYCGYNFDMLIHE